MLRSGRPKIRKQISHRFYWVKDGVITGASDDDPSGIITYTQAGAATGYSMLWLLILLTPILIAIESMASRLGVIRKEGLAVSIKRFYGFKWALLAVSILLLSNLLSAAADLAAMGEILNLWTGESTSLWVIFFGLNILLLLLRGSFKTVSLLLFWLTPFLLLYLFSAFLAHPELKGVISGFLPSFREKSQFLEIALAVIGTTISPYLVFWQSTEEAEERKTLKELKREDKGVALGMIYSNLIAIFIIIAAGATLYSREISIESAKEAALALQPLLGNLAFLFYSLGILFAGLVGIPVLLASACYAFADLFNLPASLDKKEWEAIVFYFILFLMTIGAIIIGSFNFKPLALVIFSQAVQGILMPILIYILWRLTNDQRAVGHFLNSQFNNFFAWAGIILSGFMALIFLLEQLWPIA
jgi:Mn2+/Fe2+ NRAMP family transporter